MEIAEFMLQNEGVVVTKAVDGRQAVDAFAASKPGDIDVILMDVMMPVMDGLEAATHSQPESAGREDDTDFRNDGQRLCRRRGAQPAGGHERASDQAARRPGAAEDDREIQKTRKVTALMKSILRAALVLLVRRDRGRD